MHALTQNSKGFPYGISMSQPPTLPATRHTPFSNACVFTNMPTCVRIWKEKRTCPCPFPTFLNSSWHQIQLSATYFKGEILKKLILVLFEFFSFFSSATFRAETWGLEDLDVWSVGAPDEMNSSINWLSSTGSAPLCSPDRRHLSVGFVFFFGSQIERPSQQVVMIVIRYLMNHQRDSSNGGNLIYIFAAPSMSVIPLFLSCGKIMLHSPQSEDVVSNKSMSQVLRWRVWVNSKRNLGSFFI